MEEPEEVDAYAASSASRYLARLDARAARRAAALSPASGWGMDVGCGPAAIPARLATLRTGLTLVGVDLSLPMLRRARAQARELGLCQRLFFVLASADALPFRGDCFGLVLSNSLLHHLNRPERAVAEMGRVAAGGAALFVRDLRRPPGPLLLVHLAIFGRHYRGTMRRLFEASVRAAYTCREARQLLAQLAGIRVRRRGGAHLEAVRRAGR